VWRTQSPLMQTLRRFLFLAGLALLLGKNLSAVEPSPDGAALIIALEHHWVVEVAGQRFGLIQFDTPMTTVLVGPMNFDLPVPALLLLAPAFALPALAAVGLVMHGRRRQLGFA
jgi:hypothetical protein